MPFRLNKDRRIRKTSQYKTIYESGEKRVGRLLLFFCGKPGWHETRVGITVSGKVGKAFQRNWVKRRIKEALSTEIDPTFPPSDMVFVAKKCIVDASFEDIRKDIRALLYGAHK